MQYLPQKDVKWLKVTEKTINRVLTKKNTSLHGYILKVDIYLPDELHNKQNDFSVFPEKLTVTKDMLSQQQIYIKDFNIRIGTTKKLIPNLFPKKNHIVHYRNLKYSLADGWKGTQNIRI